MTKATQTHIHMDVHVHIYIQTHTYICKVFKIQEHYNCRVENINRCIFIFPFFMHANSVFFQKSSSQVEFSVLEAYISAQLLTYGIKF